MTYYKIMDFNGKEYCVEHDGGKYIDMITKKEYINFDNKLIPLDAFMNSIAISSMQSVSSVVATEYVKNDKSQGLDDNNVIVLIKPLAGGATDSYLDLLVLLGEYGLSMKNTIKHIFTPNEVNSLYAGVKDNFRSENDYDYVKEYLISGVSAVSYISGENARGILSEKIGDKDSKKAEKGTARASIGWNLTCNGIEIVDDEVNKLTTISQIIQDTKEFKLDKVKTKY